VGVASGRHLMRNTDSSSPMIQQAEYMGAVEECSANHVTQD
jgi:hypothetical protein